MNLIDTVGVNYIFKNNLTLTEDYYLVPDVEEEVEMTELIHGKHIPHEIRPIAEVDEFDEASYLHQYKLALNSYSKRSFYSMKGFGDVSIIATVHTLLNSYERQKTEQLFQTAEPLIIYTGDANLAKTIKTEFAGKDVYVKGIADIK